VEQELGVYEILVSHSSDYQDYCRLGCYAVQFSFCVVSEQLAASLSYSEDEGSRFLRNVCIYSYLPNYMASHPINHIAI